MGEIQLKDNEQLTKYHTHVLPRLEDIYKWLKAGMTEYSIQEKLGISHDTWIRYKKQYTELSELYTRAQEERCSLVMNSMFRKSLGETAKVRKQRVTKDGDVIDFEEEQYIPADVNAADLFLRNNDPQYISNKNAGNNITINQNTVNISEAREKVQGLLSEYEKLEAVDVSEFEEIE